jgi:hypothetical protein
MAELGVVITAATVTILVAEFLRKRRRALPSYGWLGIVALASAEWLMFHGIEPVATYFTPIAWSAYILIADAAVFAVSGRSRLQDAPLVFARMALLSIPLWLIFEAYNLRLANWTYVGVPAAWPAALLGYGWSFATITPGIFVTADFIHALMPERPWPAWNISRAAENRMMITGAACLLAPWIAPRHIAEYMFGLVWTGFLLFLDPLNRRLGLPSFLEDLSEGLRGRLYSFLGAGWVCGWLWEFWNYWSAAKWHYTFRMFQNMKIFEMPVPGYFGFIPFALECFVMYVSAARALGWLKRPQ